MMQSRVGERPRRPMYTIDAQLLNIYALFRMLQYTRTVPACHVLFPRPNTKTTRRLPVPQTEVFNAPCENMQLRLVSGTRRMDTDF